MREYVITTEDTADLPSEFCREHSIGLASLSAFIGDKLYKQPEGCDIEAFYKEIRDGKMPTTSQVNPDEATSFFRQYLEKGLDVIHIAFSSGLSGTYNSFCVAAENLKEEFPDSNIIVVDSLCASLGEGLLVYYAAKQKHRGMSIKELEGWLIDNRLKVGHLFTVNDLYYLHNGGRVPKAVAVVGSIVNIKPVMHVDDDGHLVPLSLRVRGRKKSLQKLVDYMGEQIGSYKDSNEIVMISHSDCVEDAEYVKSLVAERFNIKAFIINYIGTTIGSHTGAGTVALFFMGDYR